MDKLPFFSQDVLMGERQGIGLCTLWTPKTEYQSQLCHVQVVGNLYSHFGIAVLMRNVLAVPGIRVVAVTGVDHPNPKRQQGDALLGGDLGTDEDIARDLYLEPRHVDAFYARTQLVDLRTISPRHQAELTRALEGITIPGEPLPEPIFVPLPEVTPEFFPAPRSGFFIRAKTIKDAHLRILWEIVRFGSLTSPDSEGHRRREIWQLLVVLSEEAAWRVPGLYSEDELAEYGRGLWEGDEPEGLTYRYGHTMRHKYGDQVAAILEAFQRKPETFRTVISLWQPYESLFRDDEPCLITVHPRVRSGYLDMYGYIRTNEMFRGWPMNASGLRYFQLRLAEALGVAMGELAIASGSAHLYDYDWPVVEDYLGRQRKPPLVFDPKGDWRFSFDDGRFFAEHYHEGRLVQRFSEESVDTLERSVSPFISEISHALYIGRELQKLEALGK